MTKLILIEEKNEMKEEIKKSIEFIKNIDGVLRVLDLPDISLKEKYKNLGYKIDFPSSVLIKTNKNQIYPQLNARGINCGMAVIKIRIHGNRKKNIERIKEVMLKINKGFIYNFFYKFHLPLIDKYSLKSKEMLLISEQGIEYLVDKFNLDKNIIEKFEDQGKCSLENQFEKNKFLFQKWKRGPKSLMRKMGRNFKGNHFLELQSLDEIYDEIFAKREDLKKGDLFLMYHTAGYGLQSVANEEFCQKYIFQKDIQGISNEYEKSLTIDLYSILMNFSYVYRLMTFIILRDELKKTKDMEVEFITDVPHNSLRENENFYFYRRNAIEIFENKLSIIAGSYNSNSFLISAEKNANSTNFTADHGSNELLKNKNIFSNDETIKKILLKHGVNSFLTKKEYNIKYKKDANPVINILKQEGIINPVISLKPIINLKYN